MLRTAGLIQWTLNKFTSSIFLNWKKAFYRSTFIRKQTSGRLVRSRSLCSSFFTQDSICQPQMKGFFIHLNSSLSFFVSSLNKRILTILLRVKYIDWSNSSLSFPRILERAQNLKRPLNWQSTSPILTLSTLSFTWMLCLQILRSHGTILSPASPLSKT